MENKSLYEITTELEAFNDLLEESGGEITEENEALMLRVNDLLTTKLDSCVSYMEREKDLLDLSSQKIKRLQDFKKHKQAKIARFEDYVFTCMQRLGRDTLNGKHAQIKLRKPSKILVIDDEKAVPMEYTKVETITTIDKAGLKKAVKLETFSHPSIRLEDGKKSLIYKEIK